mgnify:CR=1 FL=1
MNEITQTNFTIKVNVPNVNLDHGVMRLRYISQNPTENDRGMTFYQCADVKIVAASSNSNAPKTTTENKKEVEENTADNSCCAAQQFTLYGYETGSWRNPTNKVYYFDAVNKLFRIDSNSGNGK